MSPASQAPLFKTGMVSQGSQNIACSDLPIRSLFQIVMTGGIFAIGSVKSRWSMASWWRSGLTTFAIGSIAAGLAYAAGVILKSLAQ